MLQCQAEMDPFESVYMLKLVNEQQFIRPNEQGDKTKKCKHSGLRLSSCSVQEISRHHFEKTEVQSDMIGQRGSWELIYC